MLKIGTLYFSPCFNTSVTHRYLFYFTFITVHGDIISRTKILQVHSINVLGQFILAINDYSINGLEYGSVSVHFIEL